MGVYVAASSYSYYSNLLRDGSMCFLPILSLACLLLLLAFFYYDLGKYFIEKRSTCVFLFLKTERDIWRCKVCIKIMSLIYIVVILSLNFMFLFLSTAVQEVPNTELKHCEDVFNLTGDTSHKLLHQVAMEQNLHCIDINITDGLLSVVLVIIFLVLMIALNANLMLKCTDKNTKNCSASVVFRLSVAIVYMFIGMVTPKVLYIIAYNFNFHDNDFGHRLFYFSIFDFVTISFVMPIIILALLNGVLKRLMYNGFLGIYVA